MLTKSQVIEKTRKPQLKATDHDLKALPHRDAYIYGRVSDPSQIRNSRESIKEIAKLVKLAIEDGYKTDLVPSQVEGWLDEVRLGSSSKGVLIDGQVTVDIRDLGISGQLDADERKGFADLQAGVSNGKIGAVYVTEGVSRLSRDQDMILPYQLLKSLKQHEVRVRTPEGIWNPAVERDWEYLANEFEEAASELKTMNRRMFRRKAQKAARGEFVGEPVPFGFIVPVVGHRPNGQYEYGKYQRYAPHAEIAEYLLRHYVRSNGSPINVMRSARDMVIPFFPPELVYMERLTSLRRSAKLNNGYQISQHLILDLATNPTLIGVWQWGCSEPIADNHPAAVPESLFLEAFEIANRGGKPKGRAATSEPLEWQGMVWCLNHSEARILVSRVTRGYYSCDQDYYYGNGPACLFINARDLDEPLSKAVLEQLELGPIIEDILSRLEQDTSRAGLDEVRNRHEISRLAKQVTTYQALLPGCVDEATGKVDRERESYYWEQIRAAERQLMELRNQSPSEPARRPPDYLGVRDFLKNLPVKWPQYSRSSRNRFLKALIERVELKGSRDLEAAIYWKAGFVQEVLIHRNNRKTVAECLWTEPEELSLKRLFSSSPKDLMMAALPRRTWKSITEKASRMRLTRCVTKPDLTEAAVRPPRAKEQTKSPPVLRRRPAAYEIVSPKQLQQLSSTTRS